MYGEEEVSISPEKRCSEQKVSLQVADRIIPQRKLVAEFNGEDTEGDLVNFNEDNNYNLEDENENIITNLKQAKIDLAQF